MEWLLIGMGVLSLLSLKKKKLRIPGASRVVIDYSDVDENGRIGVTMYYPNGDKGFYHTTKEEIEVIISEAKESGYILEEIRK